MLQPLRKVVWQFLTLNKHTFSHRFSNHAHQNLSEGAEDCVHTETYAPKFLAALFIIAKTWKPDVLQQVKNKQENCATSQRWKIIQLKGNEPSIREKTRLGLECIVLSERSPSEKAAYCMVPSSGHSGKSKLRETVKKGWVVGRNQGKVGMTRWGTEGF